MTDPQFSCRIAIALDVPTHIITKTAGTSECPIYQLFTAELTLTKFLSAYVCRHYITTIDGSQGRCGFFLGYFTQCVQPSPLSLVYSYFVSSIFDLRLPLIVKGSWTDKDYYSPINNLCVPHQWDFKFSGTFIWAVPLVFDLFLVVLTSTKTYRSATLLRTESGSPIVCSFPLISSIIR